MAETEGRLHQDIGVDEAMAINLKETIAAEKDERGRSRLYFDTMAASMASSTSVSLAAINASIVRRVTSGMTASEKNDDNVININETDQAVSLIIRNAEAMDKVATLLVAAAAKKEESP